MGIKTSIISLPDYDDEGNESGTYDMEVPMCHFTPMKPNYIPYDDSFGESATAQVFTCKHCNAQIERSWTGVLLRLKGEEKYDCI